MKLKFVQKVINVIVSLNICQAVGALGELSDKSDFSLLAWDSFSQEIRDLFTVVRSITYILLSKLFEFT